MAGMKKFVASLLAVFLSATVPAMPQGTAPINVGLIYSKTGLLASYGAQYADGFAAGLDYATHGTGMASGHKIVVTERDDAGDPAKAVAAAKELIGQGYKILAGSTASGVAVQMAPLAKDNNILFISGPAATDAITGANRNTFRSGRQTYQDVLTAGTIVGNNMRGKNVAVFAQDSAFGQANEKAVEAVLGAAGARVSSIYVPLSANDFAPFAQKAKDARADMIFVAWAGATAGAMWKAMDDAGVPSQSKVVTGLDQRASYPNFGPVASKVAFLSYYFYAAPKNKVNDAMIAALKKQGKVADLFDPDGFVAAQMIVHAVEKANGEDVGKMISALEGWTFAAPKGEETVRAADHAMLQPMFVAKLTGSGSSLEPQLVRTIPSGAAAPPVKTFK
ncbi:MAG: substrate-binding domain-containing protein [Candidatus Eremiobacteraeota bacterium]|nr:substrate-binding domain-containing protein [Candidatus Eremiobacteraeota bacterium]MBV8354256.1 substrate-binding domain-containing protein [Candidatus Eremiobacteraeota bacterium]